MNSQDLVAIEQFIIVSNEDWGETPYTADEIGIFEDLVLLSFF